MLGPGEFFQGLALGGQQFFAGTIGIIIQKHRNTVHLIKIAMLTLQAELVVPLVE